MLFQVLFAIHCLGLLGCVEAGTWDDFVNNLSTDLAPLISLFGETVSKQWLSESLTVWDNLLFAMGPLGVITAVVSAIRVAGSPSLKAFIGRAQESPGTAELELLSCTSGTTAELWNEGGIARVFGRPYILEVVVRSDPDRPIELIDESLAWSTGSSDADGSILEKGKRILKARVKQDYNDDQEGKSGNLGGPNLSLNIGIRRKPRSWFRNAAFVGVLLQSGVLAFGALSVYTYPAKFPISPKQLSTTADADGFYPAQPWAFPVTFSGTMLLCSGMFLCAFMIERRSNETYLRKEPTPSRNRPPSVSEHTKQGLDSSVQDSDGDIYWIQMGDQNVGDQVFHAFIAKHPSNQVYIRSQKRKTVASWESTLLWCTLVITILGFAMQFVGLRYLHPSVALSQLGLTILMTIIRSSLRTQRLSMDGNLISGRNKRIINGHELDFFALSQSPLPQHPLAYGDPRDLKLSKEEKEIGSFFVCLSNTEAPITFSSTNRMNRIFRIRSRLAELTSASVIIRSPFSELTRSSEWKDFEVRKMAIILKEAIEGVMKEIHKMPGRKDQNGTDNEFCWIVRAELHQIPKRYLSVNHKIPSQGGNLELKLARGIRSNGANDATTPWKINCHELEAILGLWSWSKAYQSAPFKRTLACFETKEERAIGFTELNIWVPFEDQILENGWRVGSRRLHHYGYWPSEERGSTLFVSTESSSIMMCAQDLFMAFLLQVAEERIETFGGKTSFREAAKTHRTAFQLQNSHLDAMVTRFEESGLGSRDDAYSCIFSTLRMANKQPLIEDSFPRIQEAIELPPETPEAFQRVEILLQWIENHCNTEYKRAAKTNIGELYRKVIVDQKNNRELRELAFKALVYLGKSKSNSPANVDDIVLSYAWIGREVAREQDEKVFLEMFSELDGLDDVVKATIRFDKKIPWSCEDFTNWFSACNSTVIKYVLGTPSHGLNINTKDSTGRTAFSWATQTDPELGSWILNHPGIDQVKDKIDLMLHSAKEGNSELLGVLLDEDGTMINKTSMEGQSALMLAITSGHGAAVRTLLNVKYGAILSLRDKEGRNALHLAVANNHLQIARLLLNLGPQIDINARDNLGYSALSMSAENGNMDIVTYLISEGATLYHPDINHLWSSLALASKGGHVKIMEVLFEKLVLDQDSPLQPKEYFEIEKSSKTKATALLEAAKGGHLSSVELLISKGTDVNCLCEFGHTPVFVAAARGHTSVVALLCEHGADLEIVENTKQYRTPLSVAVANDHMDTVVILLAKGAVIDRGEVSTEKPEPKSTIVEAAVTGNLEMVKLLVQKGAKVDRPDENSMTALSYAAQTGHLKLAECLIANHADVEIPDHKQKTPLGHTMTSGNYEMVAVLLAAGAMGSEQQDMNGLLLSAAKNGDSRPCRVLMDFGADPNFFEVIYDSVRQYHPNEQSYNDYNISSTMVHYTYRMHLLEIAVNAGHMAVVKVLLDKGADTNKWNEKIGGPDLKYLIPMAKSLPIEIAAKTGHWDIVKLLLDRSSNLYERGRDGDSVLACAARDGETEISQLLVDGYKTLNSSYGEWPLYEAARNGHLEVVRILVKDGARIIPSGLWISPIDAVKSANDCPGERCDEILKLLESHLASSPNVD